MIEPKLYSGDLRRLKAEVILDTLYPDTKVYMVRNRGSFYRNYNPDLMELDASRNEVELSRDGILKFLPQGFVSSENEYGGDIRETSEKVNRRLKLLGDAFMPVDAYVFTQYLKAQREADSLLRDKAKNIMLLFFDYDVTRETNPYIEQMAYLLPFSRLLKGRIRLLKSILSVVLGEEIVSHSYPYSSLDTTIGYIPKTLFTVLKPGLAQEDYKDYFSRISELRDFVAEWFMPFDHIFEMEVRDTGNDANDILDYNTKITIGL